jgi:hypothetical protein
MYIGNRLLTNRSIYLLVSYMFVILISWHA